MLRAHRPSGVGRCSAFVSHERERWEWPYSDTSLVVQCLRLTRTNAHSHGRCSPKIDTDLVEILWRGWGRISDASTRQAIVEAVFAQYLAHQVCRTVRYKT